MRFEPVVYCPAKVFAWLVLTAVMVFAAVPAAPGQSIAAGDRQSLETLLQYIERPPVSLRRLTYRDDGMVHYQGNRFHPGLGRDHQLVTPVEFLAMLVPHIALRYEVRIRT